MPPYSLSGGEESVLCRSKSTREDSHSRTGPILLLRQLSQCHAWRVFPERGQWCDQHVERVGVSGARLITVERTQLVSHRLGPRHSSRISRYLVFDESSLRTDLER